MKLLTKILIAGICVIFLMFITYSVMSKSVEAQIIPEEGTITVNSEVVNEKTKLNENDVIETSIDSYATVILFESIIIKWLIPQNKIE